MLVRIVETTTGAVWQGPLSEVPAEVITDPSRPQDAPRLRESLAVRLATRERTTVQLGFAKRPSWRIEVTRLSGA
jgi:hypothetical protein